MSKLNMYQSFALLRNQISTLPHFELVSAEVGELEDGPWGHITFRCGPYPKLPSIQFSLETFLWVSAIRPATLTHSEVATLMSQFLSISEAAEFFSDPANAGKLPDISALKTY